MVVYMYARIGISACSPREVQDWIHAETDAGGVTMSCGDAGAWDWTDAALKYDTNTVVLVRE